MTGYDAQERYHIDFGQESRAASWQQPSGDDRCRHRANRQNYVSHPTTHRHRVNRQNYVNYPTTHHHRVNRR